MKRKKLLPAFIIAALLAVLPLMACASDIPPAWQAGTIYHGGDLVTHNGYIWRAQWWTQGHPPGVYNVWVNMGLIPPTDQNDNPPTTNYPIDLTGVNARLDRLITELAQLGQALEHLTEQQQYQFGQYQANAERDQLLQTWQIALAAFGIGVFFALIFAHVWRR